MLIQHFHFFFTEAFNTIPADLVEYPVNFLLPDAALLVVLMIDGIMIIVMIIKKQIIHQHRLWPGNDDVNEYNHRHCNNEDGKAVFN